jgi:DNA-binding NarL/FixJ family response regulator
MSVERRPHEVLVVDDHTIVREGIRNYLQSDGRFEVVAEAGTVAEARARINGLPWTVRYLIVDLELSDGSGIDVIRAARLREPSLTAVVLTAFPGAYTLRRALASGARGFVLKAAGSRALLSALSCVENGGVFLDPRLGDTIVATLAGAAEDEREERYRRLLALLADGLTDKEIARILGKTPAAVSREIATLLQRMGVSSRAGAVNQALQRSGGLLA